MKRLIVAMSARAWCSRWLGKRGPDRCGGCCREIGEVGVRGQLQHRSRVCRRKLPGRSGAATAGLARRRASAGAAVVARDGFAIQLTPVRLDIGHWGRAAFLHSAAARDGQLPHFFL
jgi:hypothetical protein